MMDDATAQELARLRQRIEALERDTDLTATLDGSRDPLPQTMLLSDSFLKRAFAVLGHYLVASLIVVVPIYILIFIIAMALGMGGAFQ